jgi:hypothetical protein
MSLMHTPGKITMPYSRGYLFGTSIKIEGDVLDVYSQVRKYYFEAVKARRHSWIPDDTAASFFCGWYQGMKDRQKAEKLRCSFGWHAEVENWIIRADCCCGPIPQPPEPTSNAFGYFYRKATNSERFI